MHPDVLPLLRCPRSGTRLALEAPAYRDGLVWRGTLRSEAGQRWEIKDGIVDLMAHSAAWNSAQLVNRWPLAAWGYERLWRWRALTWLSGRLFPLSEECATMVEQIEPEQGGFYLDLACSTGMYGRALARQSSPPASIVICLDHSAAMLRETARYAQAEGVQLTLVRGLAEELPFADAAFAGIACGGSFNEFTQPDRVVSEVRRSLRADGRTFWMQARRAPSQAGRVLQWLLSWGGISFTTADDLARALMGAGLAVVFEQRIGAVQLIASRGRILAQR